MSSDQVKKCASLIREAERIAVITGAGISTAAGIPDFRSPGTGLYYNLQKYHLPYPEAIFDLNYFIQHPQPFFELAKELLPGNYQPTLAHRFIRMLEEEGKLLQNYTQNIDGLEEAAHIERVIACHGTFKTATCLSCGQKYSLSDIEIEIKAGKVPTCPCSPQSIIKPDIVFFGEALPEIFFQSVAEDLPQADLLLVMGTSLNVYPVAGLVNAIRPNCPIIMINKTPPPAAFQRKMELLLGSCDDICRELAQEVFNRRL
ncbi:MAG: silent information regulator protein Sir2 [bacterium]|nr:silent information regulator protein Sir2 [bacterium]